MLNHWALSTIASALLLFAGSVSAEQRYFEFTGKVTRSQDSGLAPVGSTVRGSFNYDDATAGDYFPNMGLYDVDAELVAEINGRILVSDRTSITLYDFSGGADIVWVYSTPGIMVDHKFHRTGYFGFSLYGKTWGQSALFLMVSDFFGLPIFRGPAGRPSWASMAARNRSEP